MKRIIFVVLAAVGVALTAAPPTQAAKPAPAATVAPYWGHWATPALVYDGTGGTNAYKVSEAVSEWRKSGWNVSMTSDATRANIKVTAEMSTVPGAVGDASVVSSGGVITACTVRLDPLFATLNAGEHLAIHELGHCGGLPHSTSTKSVMYPSTNSNTAMTRPSAADIRWMAGNY